MRDTTSLAIGASVGAALSLVVLAIGIPAIHLTLSATVLLFAFTFTAIVYCSLFGWPNRSIKFDFYDLNRIIIGSCITALVVSVGAAMTSRMADTFSLNLVTAGSLSILAIGVYIAAGFSLFTLFRRQLR